MIILNKRLKDYFERLNTSHLWLKIEFRTRIEFIQRLVPEKKLDS